MEKTQNLQIVKRLLEMAGNQLEYNLFPKSFKEEHIFLSNALNAAVKELEKEFSEAFRMAVGQYKSSLESNSKHGRFHKPERLVYIKMQINQLLYAIYGERFVHEIQFHEELREDAYLNLINQIDRTALMTPEELKIHNEECCSISKRIIDEILSNDSN